MPSLNVFSDNRKRREDEDMPAGGTFFLKKYMDLRRRGKSATHSGLNTAVSRFLGNAAGGFRKIEHFFDSNGGRAMHWLALVLTWKFTPLTLLPSIRDTLRDLFRFCRKGCEWLNPFLHAEGRVNYLKLISVVVVGGLIFSSAVYAANILFFSSPPDAKPEVDTVRDTSPPPSTSYNPEPSFEELFEPKANGGPGAGER